MSKAQDIEWHGHRGCRGILPENSLPAFIKAMDLGMDCLEMDVVISKDEKVVIAHEPYMPADICTHPNGSRIRESEEKTLNLFQMDYSEIAAFNCGLKHPRFPEQTPQPVHRPQLRELFELCEKTGTNSYQNPICYTIELKSHPDYDNRYHPTPIRYAELVIGEIQEFNLAKRVVLQSFDFRVLRAIRDQAPAIRISMLLTEAFNLEQSIDELGFIPEIIGPRFDLLNTQLVDECHAKGMRVVPWTVNEVEDMKKLIEMGVDGIITDYPDRKSLIVD